MKIYASSKGLKPGIDNTESFNRMIQNAKDGTTISFVDGRFYFSGTIIIDRTIYLEGSESTLFDFMTKTTAGMIIKGGYKNRVSNITLWNHNYFNNTGETGLVINAVTHLDNVIVKGFGGRGFHFSADIEHGSGKDTSGSTLRNCAAIENGGDGFFTSGGDANNIGFFSCDARDNFGFGFNDQSFLGCQFYNCMAHANKKGHYRAIDGNNRSGFYGCYAEGDSPPSILAGGAVWVGGIAASGFSLNDYSCVIIGDRLSSAECGDVKITHTGLEFKHTTGSFPLEFKKIDRAWPHYGYRNSLSGFFHQIFTAEMGYKADYEGRQVPFSSEGFRSFFIGKTFFAEAKPDSAWLKDFQFRYGDTLLNPDYTGEGVRQWVYKKTGWTEQN